MWIALCSLLSFGGQKHRNRHQGWTVVPSKIFVKGADFFFLLLLILPCLLLFLVSQPEILFSVFFFFWSYSVLCSPRLKYSSVFFFWSYCLMLSQTEILFCFLLLLLLIPLCFMLSQTKILFSIVFFFWSYSVLCYPSPKYWSLLSSSGPPLSYSLSNRNRVCYLLGLLAHFNVFKWSTAWLHGLHWFTSCYRILCWPVLTATNAWRGCMR